LWYSYAVQSNELIARIQKAIREEGLDGWLFCNFHHRDRLADKILSRPRDLVNSRYWFYAVPVSGDPLALVHAIEADHLDGLPGTDQSYTGREELLKLLTPLAGKRWAVHVSENISAVSFLDAGMYAVLSGAGLKLVSAEGLLQRFNGVLDEEGIASHERAAAALYGIVKKVWDFVRSAYRKGTGIFEGELRRIMEDEMDRLNLERDYPPLAAAGINTANPHYHFADPGAAIREGDIIQLDLWAKEPGGIYADISWVGVYGKRAGPEAEKTFDDLVKVREEVLGFIDTSFNEQKTLTGAEVDAYCRSLLCAGGYAGAIKHRTGHGIDTDVHGSGVNLDSVEFPDTRRLLEGSCFSVEPGIYLSGCGFRTEVDVYIKDGRPRISGGESSIMPVRPVEYAGYGAERGRQFSLLSC